MAFIKQAFIALLLAFTLNLTAQSPQSTPFFYNGSEKTVLKTASDAAFISFKKGVPAESFEKIIQKQGNILKTETYAAVHGAWVTFGEGTNVNTLRQNLKQQAEVVNVSPAFDLGGYRHLVGTSLVFKTKNSDAQAAITKQFGQLFQSIETVKLGKTELIFVEMTAWEDPLSISQRIYETGLVEYAMPDFIKTLKSDVIPNDSLFTQQWYLKQNSDADIDIDSAWEVTRGLASVVVAVMDGNGYDLQHPDLEGQVFKAYDAVEDDSIPQLENSSARHGTPCAGLIAAKTNNAKGVAGVGYNTQVMPILIGFGALEGGFNTSLRILSNAAAHILKQNKVVAVSMSYSGPATFAEQDVYLSMTTGRGDKGIALFASAGNSSSTSFGYPALLPFVHAIGASTRTDQLADFSNYGTKLAIVAPGNEILALDNQGAAGYSQTDYNSNFGGTSAACPITAGVAALVAAVDTNLTAQQIINTVFSTADKIGNVTYQNDPTHPLSTWNFQMGYGRLNAYRAVLKAGDRRTNKPNLVARSVAFRIDSSVLTYRVVVVNNGTAPTTAATALAFYLSTDQTIAATDTLLGNSSIPILGIGDSVVLNFTRNACSPIRIFRQYYAGFLIDPLNEIAEISESDNEWAHPQPFFLSCLTNAPNLTRLTDSLYVVGDTIAGYRVRLTNNGTQTAFSFGVKFLLSSDSIIRLSDFTLLDTTIATLAAGASVDLAVTRFACDALPQTGRFYLGYIIDPTGVVSEKNESDNVFVSSTAYNFRCVATGCSAGTVLTSCSGSLSDGSAGNLYQNDLFCNWLIQPTGAAAVSLSFTNFETEYGTDYVRVYDGINASAPLLGSFSGAIVPPTIIGNSGSLYIVFSTSISGRFAGWSANYMCSNTRIYAINAFSSNSLAGTVTGGGVYNAGQTVTLVARANPNWRFANWVENGSIVHSLDTFRFNVAANRTIFANFEQIPACSGQTTFTTCTGSISDGSDASTYAPNLNCSWLIQPQGAKSILFKFTEFRTDYCCDYVRIYDGTNANAPLLGTFYGVINTADTIIANSGAMFISFTTDSYNNYDGWAGTYRCDSVRRYSVNAAILPQLDAGTLIGTGTYTEGAYVTLIAKPNPAFSFVNWTDSRTGNIVSTQDTYRFTINEHRYLYANFRIRPTCNGTTTLTQCSSTFEDGSGINNYTPNLDCSWLIQPNTNPRSVVLRFTNFQLYYSDIVRVYDGNSEFSPLIGEYSTSNLPKDSIIANSGQAFVRFIASQWSSGAAGWQLSYRCDTVRKYVVALRTNPTTGGTTIGSGVYTEGAYITLIARPETAYSFVNWTDERTGSPVSSIDTLRFTVGQHRYLIANFRLKPTCSGQTTLTTCDGSFEDGSGTGTYTPDLNCAWLIQPSSNPRSIVLKFTDFQVGYNDYVYIYDGTSESAPLLRSFSGSSTLPTDSVIANSGRAFVTFKTYSWTSGGQGWRMSYRCDSVRKYIVNVQVNYSAYGSIIGDGAYTEGSSVVLVARPISARYQLQNWYDTRTNQTLGTSDTLRFLATDHRYLVANFRLKPSCDGLTRLMSCDSTFEDGSGANNYTEGLNCSWLIQPTTTPRSIVLHFNNFQTESCCDYIRIYDGNSESSPLLGSFSGSTVPNDIVANSGSLFIRFNSDGSGSYSGWSASYRCDSVRRYVIAARSYSESYGTVTGGGNFVENTPVTLIARPNPGFSLVNWVNDRTGSVYSTSDTIRLIANQQLSLTAYFRLRPTCDGTTRLTAPSGSFDDGSGNLNYTENLNCSWLILPSNATRIALKFNTLSTESCCDYVRVFDGTGTNGRLLGSYSGSNTPFDSLVATSGAMYLAFTSDGSSSYAGWSATYNTVNTAIAINAIVNGGQGGTVSGSGNFSAGQLVTLRATSAIGWRFVRWTENGTAVSTQAEYSFLAATSRLLTAEFQKANYTITTSVNPSNAGTADGDGTYLAGLSANLIANAASGFRFLNWKENNVIVSTSATYNFPIDSNRTLVANFTISNGIQTLGDDNLISVYPNPTNGRFTIRLQQNPTLLPMSSGSAISIIVQNVLSQTILTTTMPAGTTEQSVELTETGMYWVTLSNMQGQKAMVKVVVW